MASISSTNISFSGLKSNYVTSGTNTNADGDSNIRDGKTNTEISISYFRNMKLDDGTSIPSGSSQISINSHFKGKNVLIPISNVVLTVTDSTPDEGPSSGRTDSNYANAFISPSNANGTNGGIQIEFSSSNSKAVPVTSGYQTGSTGSNYMNFTFYPVTKNTSANIIVRVKQNGILLFTKTQSITIQETGSGGGGYGGGS